jgi:hypothetical protein
MRYKLAHVGIPGDTTLHPPGATEPQGSCSRPWGPRGPHANFITFGDIEGKLTILRVECTRCSRRGRYNVAKLIAQYGRSGNLSKWVSDLKGDRPQRDASELRERCDLVCPDLSKVL